MKALPPGYKERVEKMVLSLHDIARPLFNIVREFDSASIETEGDDYVIIVKKKDLLGLCELNAQRLIDQKKENDNGL